MKKPVLMGAHLRAARALLRWSAEHLARESLLGVATIRRAESVDGPLRITMANIATIKRTLESAGVEIIDQNGGGPGVRLRKRKSQK